MVSGRSRLPPPKRHRARRGRGQGGLPRRAAEEAGAGYGGLYERGMSSFVPPSRPLYTDPSLRCCLLALLTSPRQIRTSGTGSTSSGEATTSVSSRSSEPLTLMTCCGVIRVLVMSGGGRSVISCVGCNAMGMLFIFVRMLPVDIGFTKVYVTRYKSGLWSVEPGDSAESLLLAAWPGVKTSSVPHRLPC